jgi:hypothetical protein
MSEIVVGTNKPPRERERRALVGEVGSLGLIALSLLIFNDPTIRLFGPVIGNAVAVGFALLWVAFAGRMALSGRLV